MKQLNGVKWMRAAVVFLALSVGVAQADSSALLKQVSGQLAKPEAMKVNFSQVKKITGFSKSLNSSGQATIVKNRGLLWVTQMPSPSTLKITANGISETRGGSTVVMSNGQEPKLKAVGTILTSLMSGDFAPLQQYFQITGTASKGAWRLSLNPSEPGVKQAISSISVSGGQYVNSVVIRERNGDQTQIQFNSARAIAPNQAGF